MAKSAEGFDLSYSQNRELSWLRFDQRVMEEAADASVPLMDASASFPSSPQTWTNFSWSGWGAFWT